MKVDTGASVSLASETTYHCYWPNKPLSTSAVVLRTYSGEQIKVIGSLQVIVRYEQQQASLSLPIMEGKGPSLLGRDWLKSISLNWNQIHIMQDSPQLQVVLYEHKDVFQPKLGTVRRFQAHIHMDPNAKPEFCKARPLLYTMRAKVEEELDCLVREGTLEPVEFKIR